jgi:hypothetical protein
MNTVAELVKQYESDNRLYLIDPRIAYRNCLVIYSFISGYALNYVGDNFPLVIFGLLVIGVLIFIALQKYLAKENYERLGNWQDSKLQTINQIIKNDPKFENFRMKNPTYDLYSDPSAYCIQEVSFGVTIYQMIEINTAIRKAISSNSSS